MNKLVYKADRLIAAARRIAKHRTAINYIDEVCIHTQGYAEPGYDGEVIATGNWNSVGDKFNNQTGKFEGGDKTPARLSEALEKLGIRIEWSDEWSSCDACGKLCRTTADSYGWTPSFTIVNDCELICHNCLDPAEHLSSLEDNPNSCNTISRINPEDYGYTWLAEYQHGFYPGQTDNPREIIKDWQEKGYEGIIFNMDRVGQFDQHFSAWARVIGE